MNLIGRIVTVVTSTVIAYGTLWLCANIIHRFLVGKQVASAAAGQTPAAQSRTLP